jgi:hypothetical protein
MREAIRCHQRSSAVISGHQRSSSWAAMGTPDEGGKSGPSVAIRTPSGSRVRFGHEPTTQRSVQHAHVESACTRSRAARRARVRSRCAARHRADAHKRRRATSHMHRHALQHERRIGDHQHKSVEPQQRLLVRPSTTHSDQKGDPGANAVWSARSNPGASALSTACASSGGGGLSGAEVSDSWYRSTAGESLQMKPPRRRRWAASGSWSSRWHSKRMSRSRDRERSSRAREGTLSKIARKRRMAM